MNLHRPLRIAIQQYWPTLTAMDSSAAETMTENDEIKPSSTGNLRRHTKTGENRSLGLARTTKLWPTVIASSAADPSVAAMELGKRKDWLREGAVMWRTPSASDAEGGVMEVRPGTDARLKLRDTSVDAMESLCGRPPRTTLADGTKSPLSLNPRFCEHLMGWPIGWTKSALAATEWCRWRRRMRGAFLRLECFVDE